MGSQLSKMTSVLVSDQIALPDFSAGAMENWGLITYRETALLYNPHASSNGDKEWVATVISHELAHMVKHLSTFNSFDTAFQKSDSIIIVSSSKCV